MTEGSVGASKRPAKKTTAKKAAKPAPKHEIEGLDPNFDLDAWIDGTTGLRTTARIVQRGDLAAERERLRDELRVAQEAQRRRVEQSVGERSPDSVQEDLDRVEEQIWESAIVVTMEDRTSDHRQAIRDQAAEELGISAKGDGDWYHQVMLMVEIADSIIKMETADSREIPVPPGGIGWERIQRIRENSGEASLLELVGQYRTMTNTAPAVQAPFSPSSSSGRGGATSRQNSARPARGESARS